jgi:hypothetical protein
MELGAKGRINPPSNTCLIRKKKEGGNNMLTTVFLFEKYDAQQHEGRARIRL